MSAISAESHEQRRVGKDQSADGATGASVKGALDIVGACHRDRHELDLQLRRRSVCRVERAAIAVNAALQDQAHPGQRGLSLLDELESLGGELRNEKREAGNVASGMGEALGEPHRDDVLRQRHHDRHGGRDAARRVDAGSHGHDRLDVQSDQLGCKRLEAVEMAVGVARLDAQVLGDDIAEIAKSFAERSALAEPPVVGFG